MTFYADSTGMAGGQVPFQRVMDPAKLGMFLNLQQAELLRLQRYREHWRFYYNKQWSFQREDGDPLVTLNYYKKVIDKSAAFLMGKGINITADDALVSLTVPFLRKVWKKNGGQGGKKTLWDMGLMGGVSGDLFVMVTYRGPTEHERRVNPFSRGKIVINVLDSAQVFPDWDPLNKEEMRSVRIETLVYDHRVTNIGNERQGVGGGEAPSVLRFTQIITPTEIVEHYQDEEPTRRPNVLGEIPIVHIKNLPSPNEAYGVPDGLEIIDVQREINEKATDVSDMVNYHAQPVTIVKGAKAKTLEKGPRQIWAGLPTDADVFNLKLEADLGAAGLYVDKIKTAMMELSDTPEGALGKIQAISNTAGVALHMQYLPLMEKTQKKRDQYGPGIDAINRLILRVGVTQGEIQLPFDVCEKCGGKIAQVLEERKDPATGETMRIDGKPVRDRKPRCFHMDKQSFQFLVPEDMRVRFVRQYSFGQEVRESPFWQVVAEHRGVSKSFWDPEPETTVEEQAEEKQEQQTEFEERAEVMAPQVQAETPNMPSSQIDVPEEPERVTVVVLFFDADTGQVVREQEVERTLVPTDCKAPEYLDPYDTETTFNDPLPKDKHLQAQLHMLFRQMGIVSRRWVQEQTPEVSPHIDEIEKQLKEEGAGTQSAGTPTEMQGEEMEREFSSHSSPSAQTGETAGQEKYLNTGRQ